MEYPENFDKVALPNRSQKLSGQIFIEYRFITLNHLNDNFSLKREIAVLNEAVESPRPRGSRRWFD